MRELVLCEVWNPTSEKLDFEKQGGSPFLKEKEGHDMKVGSPLDQISFIMENMES